MSDASKAVFLSYASQDAEAAKRIAEALRAAGVEVWFDQNELVGGDAWDKKIRGQISSCALFVPIISANTNARSEGYFRLEWKLAVDRSHLLADDHPFLFPIVIGEVSDAAARVPDKFREVQWTRLDVKQTPESLATRVAKLLSPEANAAAGPSASGRPSNRRAPSKPWVGFAWAGVGIAFALFYAARPLWQPERPAKSGRTESATGRNALTPAQELVAKARAILDEGDEINRDNYALAEELLKKAEVLDPTEATAWALHAQVSASLHWFAFDISSARREAMRVQASRALTLAPESDAAQLAAVRVQIELDQNQAESLRTLEALVKRSPENWQAWRQLARCLRKKGDADGALVALRQALKLSANHPAVANDLFNHLTNVGDFAEAERAIRELPAGRMSARQLAHDLFIELYWRGNPASAALAVAGWPSWFLVDDRGAGHAALAALWNRDPAQAQKILASYPRDFLRDYLFTGPRAVLTAWANEQAGNEEAAQADWKIARQVCERILGEFPEDREALYWKAWALARLGDRPGATAMVRLLEQREARSNGLFIFGGLAGLKAALGDVEGAVDLLAKVRVNLPLNIKPVTKAFLTLNPVFDPLRGNARFEALVAAAPGPEEKKPSAPNLSPLTTSLSPATAVADKSVAVLAFANLSDDKSNEYFSDGISEELLNVLAKVSGLIVRGRSSGFYFKGKQTRSAEIGQQLAVNYLVQGSVRRAGDRVRISAQLIRAATDEVLWSSGALDRDLKDIFAVQDEIARLIVQNLALKLGDDRAKAKTVDPEAHRLVLEGRHYLALRGDANFARSETAFRAAVEIAPDMAEAHAGWAELAAQSGRYQQMAGLAAPGSQMEEVELHAARALRLDSSLSEPHAALAVALVDAGRLLEADVEMERGIAANPNYGSHYLWRAHLHAARGRLDTALSDLKRATDLDPLAFIHLYIRGAYLGYAGRWAEALPLLDRGASLRGERFLPLEGDRALARFFMGRREEALALSRSILADREMLTLGWWTIGEALWVLRQGGAEEEAVRQGEAILAKLAPENYLRGYVLCSLGRFEEGLPLLRNIPTIARNRFYFVPIFDPAREMPAFKRLISEMNVEKEYALARANLARLKQDGTK